jgi:hypothetical protein
MTDEPNLTDEMDAIFRWFFSPLIFGERAVSLDCPCNREGKGCINYTVSELPPYYYCRFTSEPAFVPKEGGEVGDVQIYGVMAD